MAIERLKSSTVLAFLKDADGKLWFAGDRQSTWNMAKGQRTPRKKVEKKGEILYAGTGAVVMIDEVIRTFKAPALVNHTVRKALFGLLHIGDTKDIDDVGEYMRTTYMEALRAHLKSRGLLQSDTFALNMDAGALIYVGIRGRLFELALDVDGIGVVEVDAPFASGCGGMLAWGSLLTTEGSGMTVEERLRVAIAVAGKVSVGCSADGECDIVHE